MSDVPWFQLALEKNIHFWNSRGSRITNRFSCHLIRRFIFRLLLGDYSPLLKLVNCTGLKHLGRLVSKMFVQIRLSSTRPTWFHRSRSRRVRVYLYFLFYRACFIRNISIRSNISAEPDQF